MYPSNNLTSVCVVLSLLLFGVLTSSCKANDKRPNSVENSAAVGVGNKRLTMRVLWTVSAYHIGKNAAWGKAEAHNMLFKPLDINTSSITFDGQTCHNVTFETEIVDAAKYLAERYQTTTQTVGFEEKTLKVIKTDCFLPGFSEYMRLRDRRLIVPINGVLFFFEPAVNY